MIGEAALLTSGALAVVLEKAHVAQLVERFLGKEEVHRFKPGRGLHTIEQIQGVQ